MLRTGLLAALVVVLSFVLGLGRDLSIAAAFGTAAEADFIFLALLIPAVIENIFGISVRDALIPCSDAAQRQSRAMALAVSARVGWPLLAGSLLFALMLMLWPQPFIRLLVPGWERALVVAATPAFQFGALVVVVSVWAYFLSALLHLRGQFVLPLWRSVFMNVGAIFAMWALDASAVMVLACITVSLVVHLFWMQASLGREGFLPLRTQRGPKRFRTYFIPLLAATMATQFNVIGERFFASWLEAGTISQLSYAYRIATIPLTIFTLTVLSIVFTRMTQTRGRGDLEGARLQMSLALSLTFFLMVPMAVFMAFWAEEVVRLLFYRGAFTQTDVIETGAMLRAYSLGTLFLALSLLLSRIALSVAKARPIMIAGAVSVAVTLGLDYLLVGVLGGQGLALAMSIGAIVNALCLLALLRADMPTPLRSFALWLACSLVLFVVLSLWPLQGLAGLFLSIVPVALIALGTGYLDLPLRREIAKLAGGRTP